MQPAHYECNECQSSWAEYQAKKCPYCMSKDILILWKPGKKGVPEWMITKKKETK